jgi:hypothetical protein
MGYDPLLGKQAFVITGEDAMRCAAKNITVITTLSFLKYLSESKTYEEIIRNDIILPNLRLLKKAHVVLVIGVDQFHQTSKDEALFVATLNVFSNLELLKIWCEATPMLIFPDRKIGKLSDGYEASFLILEGDPVNNFLNTTKIIGRYKQRFALDLP